MAKKFMGKLLTSVALATGAALALKYFKQYKDLDNDFEEDDVVDFTPKKRDYTVLKSKANDFINAAKETANVAKNMATPAKEIFNEVTNIVNDKVKDFVGNSDADISEDELDSFVDEESIEDLYKLDSSETSVSISADEEEK